MQSNAVQIPTQNQGDVTAGPPGDDLAPESASNEPDLGSGDYDPQLGDWQDIRADGDIQFSPVELPEIEQEPPGWLENVLEWIADLLAPLGRLLGLSWPVLKWVLLAIAIVVLLLLLYRLLAPALDWRPGAKTAEAEPEWTPNRDEAIALLGDADRLAQEGDFDGATHLLLKRSVNQMATARPDWVEPSSTARELAALTALPDSARSAFSTIAERVERSLFALRKLGQDDWEAARDAYSRFALERL